jgi:hypothetical protein
VIRVKSKWQAPKDFFIDGIKLQATPASSTPPPATPNSSGNVLRIRVPSGMRVRTETSSSPHEIVISVPEGTKIEYD